MSLFKAYKNPKSVRTLSFIKKDFQEVFDAVCSKDKIDVSDVITLVAFYAEYGVSYMTMIATSLEEPRGASETMKFMNSIIAETVNAAGIHYFNRERGYSIIDKAVQKALDNNGVCPTGDIMDIIVEIENSYEEDEVMEVPKELLAKKGK